jgi:N-acetylglutamate synthase-like GNAT family acetyltransferase
VKPTVSTNHPGDVQVRIAGTEDAETITRVINAAFRIAEGFFVHGDRIDDDSVLQFLDKGKFLLAESDGVASGCVYIEPRGDRAYLGLLSVDPSRQQSGVGSLLMNAGEDYCRRLSCRFMDIKIVNLRTELPDFYRKRGYVETGTSAFPEDVETLIPCHFIDMSKSLR